MTRRDFLATAAAGVAVGALAASGVSAAAAEGGYAARVVAVKSAGAFAGTSPDAAVVAKMLDAAAGAFRGGAAADLWKSLFTSDDVVGIKLNCISRTVKPNKELIDAVIAALKCAGVKENNIIIWDRFEEQLARRARLKVNRSAEGVRIYGTELPDDGLSGYDTEVFYETDADTPEYRAGTGDRSLVTKIVTKDCTKILNMPVLKDHNQAGVTGCLKNLTFGAVNNTARFHKAPMYCSPAVADIYAIPAIRQKTVLHVLDALRVCYNGGPDAPNPAFVSNFSTIYLATDPVACDTIGLEVVQRLRKENNLGDLYQTSGHPVHVADSGKKGLGTDERAKIELVEATV
jgi:hypothetical protein